MQNRGAAGQPPNLSGGGGERDRWQHWSKHPVRHSGSKRGFFYFNFIFGLVEKKEKLSIARGKEIQCLMEILLYENFFWEKYVLLTCFFLTKRISKALLAF